MHSIDQKLQYKDICIVKYLYFKYTSIHQRIYHDLYKHTMQHNNF